MGRMCSALSAAVAGGLSFPRRGEWSWRPSLAGSRLTPTPRLAFGSVATIGARRNSARVRVWRRRNTVATQGQVALMGKRYHRGTRWSSEMFESTAVIAAQLELTYGLSLSLWSQSCKNTSRCLHLWSVDRTVSYRAFPLSGQHLSRCF